MSELPAKRLRYSRAEYISDAVVHIAGLAVVVGAVPVLIVLTALLNGTAISIIGVSIYGAALLAMILCSALYNLFPSPDWAWLLRRLDHSAIYLKIAGTFTVFALLAGQGVMLLVGLWSAALAGVTLKIASPTRFKKLGLTLYLGMGWIGAVLGWSMFAALPMATVTMIAIGGCLYTVGVVFYLWERLPHHNTIWHVFVLAASLVFYAAVMVAVLS